MSKIYKTKEIAIAHLLNGETFSNKPFVNFRNDRDCVLAAIRANCHIGSVPVSMQDDLEVMTLAIQRCQISRHGHYAPSPKLMNIRAFAITAVKRDPSFLKMVPLELLDDEAVAKAFLMSVSETHEIAYHHFLKTSATEFGLFSERIRDTEHFVFEALLLNERTFGFASDRLRDDTAFLQRSINAAPKCLKYASERARGNKFLVLSAFNSSAQLREENPLLLSDISHSLRFDQEVVEAAIQAHAINLTHASEVIRNHLETQLFAVKASGSNIYQRTLVLRSIDIAEDCPDPVAFIEATIRDRDLQKLLPEKQEAQTNKVKI